MLGVRYESVNFEHRQRAEEGVNEGMEVFVRVCPRPIMALIAKGRSTHEKTLQCEPTKNLFSLNPRKQTTLPSKARIPYKSRSVNPLN